MACSTARHLHAYMGYPVSARRLPSAGLVHSIVSHSVARRSQEWTRACYGLIACSHGWFFRFPRPHTYQEVCMNAYIMTLIQGKKFRTRKHSSEHIRRHHRQHRSDTRPRSQREHGSTWAENGGNNHQQRDELQKMAPVPAPSSQRSPVSGLRRAAKGGENAWGATVARGEAG